MTQDAGTVAASEAWLQTGGGSAVFVVFSMPSRDIARERESLLHIPQPPWVVASAMQRKHG
jgi:hypothetical protein